MARQKITSPTIETSEVPQQVVEVINEGVNQYSEHSANILSTYGDGESEFDLYIAECRAREAMERGARAMVDAGRYLITIKEHVAQGEWLDSLDRIGLAPRMAQKLMQAAFKFLSSPGSKKLLDHVGNKTKALELLVLDEGDLEQLGAGGTVAGLTLDEVDRMSCSELRKALREARESQEDQQRIIADKNKKIDDQSKQINRIKKLPPDETIQKLRVEITKMVSTIDHDLRVNLFDGLNDLTTYGGDNDLPQGDFIRTQIEQLEGTLSFLRENLVQGVEWE